MKYLVLILFSFYYLDLQAQYESLPFDKVTYRDLETTAVGNDTSANAIVLDERGRAYIDMSRRVLVYEYYVKIKIFTKSGLKYGSFSVPLKKYDNDKDSFVELKGSTYNMSGSSMIETKLNANDRHEEPHKYAYDVKFKLPDVREGSVIEVRYKTETRNLISFHTWEFQSGIPKLRSEYTISIPAYYAYNITLRGFLKLSHHDTKLIQNCYSTGSEKGDCGYSNYVMENIPAFKIEDYMTARKNFLAAIYFDLSEMRNFFGRTDDIQKQWTDVDDELSQHENFGKQIKKARRVLDDKVKEIIGTETNNLRKAKLIYEFVASYYTWNEIYGIITDNEVKVAYEKKAGNDADINLSLIGALQQAGLDASPVILSTRSNGLVIDIHPSLSSFNYVIASVEIDGTQYLLDGTNAIRPFGVLPVYCLNGKGRIIGKKSGWIEIKPISKFKTTNELNLVIEVDGNLNGQISISSYGYDADNKRSKMRTISDQKEYLEKLRKSWRQIEILDYQVDNLKDTDQPVLEKLKVKIPWDTTATKGIILLNPFFIDRLKQNPFHLSTRLYPVDYGAPLERSFVINIDFPNTMVVDDLPKNVGLTLPNAGGKYIFSVNQLGNKLTIISNQNLTHPVYNAEEYHSLKELYANVVQAQQSQIVFKRK